MIGAAVCENYEYAEEANTIADLLNLFAARLPTCSSSSVAKPKPKQNTPAIGGQRLFQIKVII